MNASRIINTHDQLVAAGGGVAIVGAYGPGRDSGSDGVLVYRVVNGRAVVTDSDAVWYFYGRKHFSAAFAAGRTARAEAQAQAAKTAQTWVREQGWYAGIWVRNAMRDYVPEDVQRRFPIVRSVRKTGAK